MLKNLKNLEIDYKEGNHLKGGGYINLNSGASFSYVELDASRKFKSSSLTLVLGLQNLEISDDDKNKIFHAGLRYAINF